MTNFSLDVKYDGATLLLFGENINPEKLDSLCAVQSDKSYKKGDIVSQKSKITAFRKNGMWSIKGKNHSFSEDLDYFIQITKPLPKPIMRMEEIESIRISLWIDDYTESTLEIQITPEDLKKIIMLEAELYITCFKKTED